MRNEVMSLEFSGYTIIPKVSAQTLWLAPGPAVHETLAGGAAGAALKPHFPACRLPDIWATCTAILGCLEATRQSAAVGPYPVTCWVPDVWLLVKLQDIQAARRLPDTRLLEVTTQLLLCYQTLSAIVTSIQACSHDSHVTLRGSIMTVMCGPIYQQ